MSQKRTSTAWRASNIRAVLCCAAMDIKSLLLARCPRCNRGAIFKSGLAGALGSINERCPVCGLVFLRESGYFLGAMYVSYGLGVITILPVASVLAVVLEWPLWA